MLLLDLPIEILDAISRFLHVEHAKSLQSVAQTCRHLHSISIRSLFKIVNLSLKKDPQATEQRLSWWQDFFQRRAGHDIVRKVHVQVFPDISQVSMRKGIINPASSLEMLERFLFSLPNVSDIYLQRLSQAPHRKETQTSLLKVIFESMQACRVHIEALDYSLVQASAGMISPAFAYLNSRKLRSLGLDCYWHDEKACCFESIGQYIGAGLAPNLDYLALKCVHHGSATERLRFVRKFHQEALSGEFSSCSIPSIHRKLALKRLDIVTAGINLAQNIPIWSEHMSFDSLRMLRLDVSLRHSERSVYDEFLQPLLETSFLSLKAFSFHVRLPLDKYWDHKDFLRDFQQLLKNLRPLESLEIAGNLQRGVVDTVMQYHGKSLRSLFLLSRPEFDWSMTPDHFPELVENMPLLESLGIHVFHDKPLDNSALPCYTALGRLCKLRNLQIILDVDPKIAGLASSPSQNASTRGRWEYKWDMHWLDCILLYFMHGKPGNHDDHQTAELCNRMFGSFAMENPTGKHSLKWLSISLTWSRKGASYFPSPRIYDSQWMLERHPRDDCSDQVLRRPYTYRCYLPSRYCFSEFREFGDIDHNGPWPYPAAT